MPKSLALLAVLVPLCVISKPVAAADAERSLKVIYSNFTDDPDRRFAWGVGLPLSAKDSGEGRLLEAMPFAPAEDSHIQKFKAALSWIRGTNAVTVSLRADAAGLPGEVIAKFELVGLQKFGQCCKLTSWSTKPIPVVAGTRYWLVARPTGDSELAWNGNLIADYGTYAFKRYDGWQHNESSFGAYSVLGD